MPNAEEVLRVLDESAYVAEESIKQLRFSLRRMSEELGRIAQVLPCGAIIPLPDSKNMVLGLTRLPNQRNCHGLQLHHIKDERIGSGLLVWEQEPKILFQVMDLLPELLLQWQIAVRNNDYHQKLPKYASRADEVVGALVEILRRPL